MLGPIRIEGLQQLSGGASRETWSFDANDHPLILRRDPPGRPGVPGSMALEANAMRACGRAGLRVPEVIVDDDGSLLGTAGLVMSRVPGETLARRILRDDEFAHARTVLTAQLGEFLAGLHSVPVSEVPGVAPADTLTAYWTRYEQIDDVSPTFKKSYEWLLANAPVSTEQVVVHGDLRMGNIIVDNNGLAAAIDWELVHLGDPLEDLGWLCVKAWRFGSPLPVGGVGEIDELIDAYESCSGRTVDRDAFHWWLVMNTLKWGIGCMGQASVHLTGAVRSVELAAIGRRVCEQEWDLIELLAPDEWAAARADHDARARADTSPDTPGMHGRPTARELLEAVREFLTNDVMPRTDGRLSFHARVAANVVSIVERELAMGDAQRARFTGATDWASLAAAVRDRLAVANPKHLTR